MLMAQVLFVAAGEVITCDMERLIDLPDEV
jgi:hypothetical protein